ncbi:MAG: DUF3298 domain-containing protein [Muribaculaceae bacterium]|nr:DUF3298 domain-containing protein [Muribaculaceae bacterium]
MNKSLFISLLILLLAIPHSSAVTFKTFKGERAFYMPELTEMIKEYNPEETMAEAYEVHRYEIAFPINGSNALKQLITKEVFGESYYSDINYSIETFLNSFIGEEYSTDNPQLINQIPEFGPNVQLLEVNGELKFQRSNLIVYKASAYQYESGAAHGMYGESYLNFYIPTQQKLKLSDILLTSSKKSAINKAVRSNARKVADALYDPDNCNSIEYSETFYLSSQGITFVYQPYEIGPWAAGVIEITVPKNQLSGCLTSLGQKLLK